MIRYCTELQSVQYLNPHAVSVQEEEHMKKESMEVVGRIVKTREGAIWHSCNKKGQHIKSASDVPGSMAHVLLVRE